MTSFSLAKTNLTSFESVKSISSEMRGSTRSNVARVTDESSAATGKTLYILAVEAGMALVTSESIVMEARSIASVSWSAARHPRSSSSVRICWSMTVWRTLLDSVLARSWRSAAPCSSR